MKVIGLSVEAASLYWLAPLVALAAYLYCRRRTSYWRRRGVPQLADTDLLFGDYKDGILFRTPPAFHLGEVYKKAPRDAPYLGFYIFQKPCILLRDPSLVKAVLITDFENFSDRYFSGSTQKDSINMRNLFGVRNPTWDYLRSKLSPMFTLSKLRQTFPLMLETGAPMLDYIERAGEKKANGARVVDAQDLNYKYTADLIANLSLGLKTDSFNFPNSDYTKTLMYFFHGFKRMVALVTVFFVPGLVRYLGNFILLDLAYIRKIFWEALEDREQKGEAAKRGDLVDAIIQLKNGKQNDLYRFEGDNLYAQLGIYFSGFETSCITATFTLVELARDGELQRRAREDVQRAVDKLGWTFDAFNSMKFLDQCLAESARLYPSVSTIDRCTKQDYKLPGTDVVLERGTPVYISLYGLHRDERFFSEPLQYRPERFRGDDKVSDAYMPFGVGPRMCVGSKIGLMHAKIWLAKILTSYSVSMQADLANKLDPRSTFTVIEDEVKMEFRKIQ